MQFTRLYVTDPHGGNIHTVTVANTEAAEKAATTYLKRICHYEVGDQNYRVWFPCENSSWKADTLCKEFAEYLFPRCEHGLSAQLCEGPNHYGPDRY